MEPGRCAAIASHQRGTNVAAVQGAYWALAPAVAAHPEAIVCPGLVSPNSRFAVATALIVVPPRRCARSPIHKLIERGCVDAGGSAQSTPSFAAMLTRASGREVPQSQAQRPVSVDERVFRVAGRADVAAIGEGDHSRGRRSQPGRRSSMGFARRQALNGLVYRPLHRGTGA